MKRVPFLICAFLIFWVVGQGISAQNVSIYDGMTWYLRKTDALNSARSQGKQVFFLWGRTTCAYSNATRRLLAKDPLKSVVDENYILWFADAETYDRFSPDVDDYLSGLPSYITFPAICIIDTFDVKVPHGLRMGPQSEEELQEMLNRYVANDYVEDANNSYNAYVYENSLVITSSANEEINVYTVSGSLIDRFHKTEHLFTRSTNSYPSGILFVTGSSGWIKKVIVR